MIHYGWQDIRQEDIDAVVDVLPSDLIAQGHIVPRFEEAVSERFGASNVF
jgi:Predicted pyridoxal phosphate-dependent enzyme apparently involved in regulation of cell wall biogenesis